MEYDVSDSELIYLYRCSNFCALKELKERYKKRIYGVIEKSKNKYSVRRIDFEDIYHACFIAFMKCVEKFDDEYIFYSYVIKSIENVILREIKKETKDDYIESVDHDLILKGNYGEGYISDSYYLYEENQIRDYLDDNLDELSIQIVKYKLEGYTLLEITSLLGVSSKVLYNRMCKIKKLLKNGIYH